MILYLDFHGHSVKKNVFAYGPSYPMYDVNLFISLPTIYAEFYLNYLQKIVKCLDFINVRLNYLKKRKLQSDFMCKKNVISCIVLPLNLVLEHFKMLLINYNRLTKTFLFLWDLKCANL